MKSSKVTYMRPGSGASSEVYNKNLDYIIADINTLESRLSLLGAKVDKLAAWASGSLVNTGSYGFGELFQFISDDTIYILSGCPGFADISGTATWQAVYGQVLPGVISLSDNILIDRDSAGRARISLDTQVKYWSGASADAPDHSDTSTWSLLNITPPPYDFLAAENTDIFLQNVTASINSNTKVVLSVDVSPSNLTLSNQLALAINPGFVLTGAWYMNRNGGWTEFQVYGTAGLDDISNTPGIKSNFIMLHYPDDVILSVWLEFDAPGAVQFEPIFGISSLGLYYASYSNSSYATFDLENITTELNLSTPTYVVTSINDIAIASLADEFTVEVIDNVVSVYITKVEGERIPAIESITISYS